MGAKHVAELIDGAERFVGSAVSVARRGLSGGDGSHQRREQRGHLVADPFGRRQCVFILPGQKVQQSEFDLLGQVVGLLGQ